MGVCYKPGREQGLWFQIQEIEKVIKLKKKRGADTSFGESLVKSYKDYQKKHGNNVRQAVVGEKI